MSPDRVDLAEDALASSDPATLYADLLDDWNELYGRVVRASRQLLDVANSMEDQRLKDYLKAQSEGVALSLSFMREYRAAPES